MTKDQVINEALGEFWRLHIHNGSPATLYEVREDCEDCRFNQRLRQALSQAMDKAVEVQRLKEQKTADTYKENCDCIQCYFIRGYDQAVQEQTNLIDKFN